MRRRRAIAGSLVFLLVAPGIVAGVVPWLLTGWETAEPIGHRWPIRFAGVVLIVAGVAVLLESFARFVLEGRGTPAPLAPTDRLVVGGLYRHVRNPMYLAVLATILGQALLLWRPILLGYAAAFGLAVWVFVRGYEEPTLTARYGSQYTAYRASVPGWWPRLRPWKHD